MEDRRRKIGTIRTLISVVGFATAAFLMTPQGKKYFSGCRPIRYVTSHPQTQRFLDSTSEYMGFEEPEEIKELKRREAIVDECFPGRNLWQYSRVFDLNGDKIPEAIGYQWADTDGVVRAVLYTPDWKGERTGNAEPMSPRMFDLATRYLQGDDDALPDINLQGRLDSEVLIDFNKELGDK